MNNTIGNILYLLERIDPQYRDYSLLTEGITSEIYHFTSLRNAYNIALEDKIYLQSAYAKDADNYDKKRKFYLSCTRIRNAKFGYSRKFNGSGARIVLDGELLSQTLKGKPVNYWNGMVDKWEYMRKHYNSKEEIYNSKGWEINRFKKEHPEATQDDIDKFISMNFNTSAQEHISNESEDRIFSYKSVINNVSKYIKSIDIIINPEKEYDLNYASAILYNTPLSGLVKIYTSVEEFNKIDGKTSNDTIPFERDTQPNTINDSWFKLDIKDILTSVILFITCENEEYNNNNFCKKVSSLLNKYQLDEFNSLIGEIYKKYQNSYFMQCVENMNAIRRSISDSPNRYTSKLSQMLTDHMLSIGANSFRDAYMIKKENMETSNGNEDRALKNPSAKYPLFVVKRHTLSLYPNKEKYIQFFNEWDMETIKYMIVGELIDGDKHYNISSKNDTSLEMFIKKLLTKGTVKDVYDTMCKFGFDDETIENIAYIQIKNLDFFDAQYMDTLSTKKMSNYTEQRRFVRRELKDYFKKLENNLS